MLLVHWMRRAASRADCTAGSSKAISTAMMAMTTRSSIRVNPSRPLWDLALMATLSEVRTQGEERATRIRRVRNRGNLIAGAGAVFRCDGGGWYGGAGPLTL